MGHSKPVRTDQLRLHGQRVTRSPVENLLLLLSADAAVLKEHI